MINQRSFSLIGGACLSMSWTLCLIVVVWVVSRSVAVAQAQEPTATSATLIRSTVVPPTGTPEPTATLLPIVEPTVVPPTGTPEPTATQLPPLTRIEIPSIDLNAAVETVGRDDTGEWIVPDQHVGHHTDSALPGENGKIILNGHVAMPPNPVFSDLHTVVLGEEIYLYRDRVRFSYTTTMIEYIPIDTASPEYVQREANRIFAFSENEVLILITCFPDSGPLAFTERLIVWATPSDDHESRGTH